MEYRLLGNSGLKVSVLGFGIMTFESLDQGIELLRTARKGGVNFFDNAEFYGVVPGNAELLFGQALKKLQQEDSVLWRRSDLVITTKLFFGPNPTIPKKADITKVIVGVGMGANEFGVSRKHLVEGMKASLKRLQLDYVDVVYAHRFDHLTPMVEIVRGFTYLINQGYALYWGTSSWPPNKIIEAFWVAKLYNLIPPITEQPIYNMFNRNLLEDAYLDVFQQPYGIGTTIYAPLDRGILTGKYNKRIPEGSRLHQDHRWAKFFGEIPQEKIKKCVKLEKICSSLNCSMTSLAIGWCLKNKNVSCVLLGASKSSQLADNLRGVEVARKLTRKDMENIDKILNNKPERNPLIYTQYRTCPNTLSKL